MTETDVSRFQIFYGPEGRMTLVDRALEAVNRGAISIGLRFPKYAIIASMVRPMRRLVEPSEKVFQIDQHVGATGSGYVSDLQNLVENMRIEAQRHRFTYGGSIDILSLVRSASQYLHAYTLYPVRPQGVATIVAGADKLGVHLYQVDPSGTFFKGEAFAVGQNSDKALEDIEREYSADLEMHEALRLVSNIVKKAAAQEPLIQHGYVRSEDRLFIRPNGNAAKNL